MKTTKNYKYFKYPKKITEELHKLQQKPSSFWEKKGEKSVLGLTEYVIKNVPAYKKFLKTKKKSLQKISSISDFKQLPLTTKKNYLKRYPYIDLFPKKEFFSATTFSATSGSSGEPFYFPRSEENDSEYEFMSRILLRDQFNIDKKKTLGIMGFALGVWIGGIFTYKNFNKISNDYDFTLIPTGTNRDQFLSAIKKFGHLYDQVILMGYPPFIKDVIDEGLKQGIRWGKYDLKILTAAEGFSENFRKYIGEKAELENYHADILNMYGTVEAGTMAHETALTNIIRHLAVEKEEVFEELFPGATNIPTLAQYYPHIHNFEQKDGELLVTGYGSSIPLLRYRLYDLGGVITFEEMLKKLRKHKVYISKEMKKFGISKKILKLPFVYLYARSDFTVIFRGANIYPEEIRTALDSEKLSKKITGRFTLEKIEKENAEHKLRITVELRKNTKGSSKLKKDIKHIVIKEMCARNSEYKNEYESHKQKATPEIILEEFGDKEYFGRTGKQQWVKK